MLYCYSIVRAAPCAAAAGVLQRTLQLARGTLDARSNERPFDATPFLCTNFKPAKTNAQAVDLAIGMGFSSMDDLPAKMVSESLTEAEISTTRILVATPPTEPPCVL